MEKYCAERRNLKEKYWRGIRKLGRGLGERVDCGNGDLQIMV